MININKAHEYKALKNSTVSLLMLLIGSLPFSVHAQWHWIDAQGSKIYSDQPPPVGTPVNKILKKPVLLPTANSNLANEITLPEPDDIVDKKDVKNPQGKIEKDKKSKKDNNDGDLSKDEQAKIEAKNKATKIDNCNRAKSAKLGMDSGLRMAKINDKGERIFLDAAALAVENKRIDGIIQSNCK